MIRLSDQHTIYAMAAANPPALEVASGSRVQFETCDCFHGQIQSAGQRIDALDWERINPATGPVFVTGAAPGDALRVRIESIEFTGPGIMAAIPDVGIWGGTVTESRVRLMDASGGDIDFGDGIRLPAAPMVGVIGTAPKTGAVPCGTPGDHGGNMDCTKIAPGAVLYLPVWHAGGLLAMGDVHAAMGDGEIMGTGIEIPALVTVTVDVVQDAAPSCPLVLLDGMLYAVTSADTLEQAAHKAADVLCARVMAAKGLDTDVAGMLLSAAGQVQVCQMVDPQVTVRMGLPAELCGF